MMAKAIERCESCNRQKKLTKHHLVPRAVHTKKRFANRFGKKEMRQRGLMLCRECAFLPFICRRWIR